MLILAGLVSGGVTEIADGVVEIRKASSENVSFLSDGIGGLQLDNASAYGSGFGGSAHSKHKQFIDLAAVPYSAGVVSESYSGNATSGVLTVTSGGATVAAIHMVGQYVTSNFVLGADKSGSATAITDLGSTSSSRLSSLPGANNLTLGYSNNGIGGLPVVSGVRAPGLTLLCNYIAARFAAVNEPHGGVLSAVASDAIQQFIAPHKG